MHVGVIYATRTGVRRRTVVTDDRRSLNAFMRTAGRGEAYVEVPHLDYRRMTSAHDLDQWLSNNAPHRTQWREVKSGRCVEVDALGTVIAVYSADPGIDAPLSRHNRLHESEGGALGQLKVREGYL